MKRITFLFGFLILAEILFAIDPAVGNFSNSSLLKNANISLLVKNTRTNEVLYELNSKKSLVTASTMKLITTATALEKLGSDFRFETTLEVDGKIEHGVLYGNLIIRGSGDPTLGSEKIGDKNFMFKWVEAIKKLGINRINGSVIANTAIFDNQPINPKWLWEDMGNYFAPGIYGLSYLDNTFRLILSSTKAGEITKVLRTEPEIEGLSIKNDVVSSNIAYDNAYFYAEPLSYSRNIRGEIPANRSEFTVKGDIPNPALLLAQDFRAALIKNGIEIKELPSVECYDRTPKTKIYTHFSVPLIDIITETNITSNNFFAECLFKYLSVDENNQGSNELAAKTIRSFWKQRGLSVDELFQYDGSGLSPSNAVSANFFVELLSYMNRNSKNKDVFYKTLALAGVNGTLRSFLDKTKLQGKVSAKSGTIERVKSYAGYIHLGENSYVFCVIINNASGKSHDVQKQVEKFLLELDL